MPYIVLFVYNVYGMTESRIKPTHSRSRGIRSTTETPLKAIKDSLPSICCFNRPNRYVIHVLVCRVRFYKYPIVIIIMMMVMMI